MSKTLLPKAMTFLSLLLLVSTLHAQANDATADTTAQQGTTSKVRIVRLSQVRGAVEIERNSGRGFEPAIANLPIVEQNQLRTGVGIAEVEFEDNSSLRLAPNSAVEFPMLGRNASGATVSSIHLIKGTAYISLVKPQNGKAPVNEFALIFGDRNLKLDPATHIRLEIEGTQAKLAVLDGEVRADGTDGAVTIPKKKTATFDMFAADEPTVAKDVAKTEFDEWDHNAASYHSNVSSMSAFNSPYAYGTSDMAYYGSFLNAGGCGSMWRPYFASAAWDPFANGSWAWYQGAGYSWVSPYPWAWTPYHSGAWSYCPNVGWGWMPGGGGGGWYGLNNVAALAPAGSTGGGVIGRRLPPPHPPQPREPTLIASNTKPLTSSQVASATSFEFRKDSAGLGVPRETLGHLDKFSRETLSHGVARTQVYISVPESGRGENGRITMSQAMGASVHRGNPPSAPSTSSSSWSSSSSGLGSSSSSSVSSSRSSVGTTSSGPSAPSGGSHK